MQHLLSLPPQMARLFEKLEGRRQPDWFAASDPPGTRLGSGGATVHVLVEAWRATGSNVRFTEWLRSGGKLVIHGGGESRRLPAYAAVGKPIMPVPVLRWSRGQRLDQSLLDLQVPLFDRILSQASQRTVAMVASGDILLRFGRDLGPLPDVDVVGIGMWVMPEKAKNHGVFFSPRQSPGQVAFFLQKPTSVQIRELAADYLCLVDTGMWLLSERAIEILLERSGWNAELETFTNGLPGRYELYDHFGLGLGTKPSRDDPPIRNLTCAVVPLPQAEFYHFGTSRQMIESASALQNLELDETKLGVMGSKYRSDRHPQNSLLRCLFSADEHRTLWVENSHVPARP